MGLQEDSFLERSSRNWKSGQRGWVNKNIVDTGVGQSVMRVKVEP